ncbi:heparan-alpha-glucosaminide N-acetyltransferase [Nitratireductor sp. GCM10026969]|uniref:heparan-alpha-glucosaminide N-acetyltransferase n=1 Tax=Nitratireductor sp. GCM10026969 TaxID=3252645 RepID=UPI003615AA8B
MASTRRPGAHQVQSSQSEKRRIELIDVARGTALVAMAVYHFTWDLDFFGYIEPGTSVRGGWWIFARSIAGSFLFLVGVSLYLAHGQRILLRAFTRRTAVIALAAAGITVVTYFATPDAFIFFGILHNITVASVLGLLFLRLPAVLILVCAAAALAAPLYVQADFLDQPIFWWTGLSRNVPGSNDYIPIFPWFGVVLAGIAVAKIAAATGLLARLATFRPAARIPLLAAAGRHGLAFYLLHQPVLVSLVWIAAQVAPPPAPDREALFLQACGEQCASQHEENFCRAYCACVLEAAVAENRFEELYNPQRNPETQSWIEDVAFRCSVENNGGEAQ